jgi:hypothetical protein
MTTPLIIPHGFFQRSGKLVRMNRVYVVRPPEDRFWKKVDKQDGNGCWEWTGALVHGYGYFGMVKGDTRKAHRVAYEWEVGPIPEDRELDHLCLNTACIRPDHLEAVTHQVNMLRGMTFAAEQAARATCPKGHPYSSRNSRGERECYTCKNARRRKS